MKSWILNHKKIIFILLLAAFIRLVGITWAFPYHPHPDEWNMAAAVSQMKGEDKLNPHFFAYGQFPLYLSFFSARLYNLIPRISLKTINIQEATFFLRFWSALAGVGTVYLVYLISQKLLIPLPASHFSLLAAILAALTPGLIQNSHFGTTESLLSFFFLLILYLCLLNLEKEQIKNYFLGGVVLGLAVGTKISALVFGFPIFLVFIFNLSKILKNKNKLKNLGKLFFKNLILLILLLLVAFLVCPYLVLALKESRGTLLYETSVATGKSPVFYARQFINTIPIVFQFQKIFPYALGWPIFIAGILGFLLSTIAIVKNLIQKKYLNFSLSFFIFNFSFLIYFFSQAFLFCKWTRFMAPIFAFFPIFAVFFFQRISSFKKSLITNYQLPITFIAIIPGILFSTIYFRPDIRFTASEWIYKNIPSGSKILFDTGNVVDIPVRSAISDQRSAISYELVSFDFYHLDENPELFPQLLTHLQTSDYIFVPSKRLYANMLRLPEKFPAAARYYQLLFSEKLGFKEIKTFDVFSISKFTISDEPAEETWTVFDHPVIRIYQKNVELSRQDYEKLFKESQS